MKKANVTQQDYKDAAQNTAAYIKRQAEKLAEISRNLSVSADFSPCTIESMRTTLADMKELSSYLTRMSAVSVQRGLTAIEEEKVRTVASLDARKAALLDGTLRLNRRVSDMAAE